MPYIVFILGILLGIFALYHFVKNSTAKEIGALVLTLGILVISGAIFFLTISGRLPIAMGIIAALWPAILAWWKSRQNTKNFEKNYPENDSLKNISIGEALKILGLKENATQEDVRKAHKRLIQKLHPDKEGSEWLAKKVNAARDILLKNNKETG